MSSLARRAGRRRRRGVIRSAAWVPCFFFLACVADSAQEGHCPARAGGDLRTYCHKTSRFAEDGAPPAFIVASPDKTGSTAIFADLTAHPEIANVVSCKEVCYFGGKGDPASLHEKDYLKMFVSTRGCPSVLTGEACPEYFTLGLSGASQIASRVPNVKIMIFARDPVSRLLSRLVGNFEHQKMHKYPTCGALVAAYAEEQATNATQPTDPVALGCYAARVETVWRAIFGDRVLVLASEWFSSEDTAPAALAVVAKFLDIAAWRTSDLAKQYKGSKSLLI